MAEMSDLQRELEELFDKVRTMKPGGDLEELLEERTAALKRKVYERALEERAQAAEKADFPPSGL